MHLRSRIDSRACGITLLLGTILLSGCGDSGPPTGTVSGTVTEDGKPANVTVIFLHKSGVGGGSGTTDSEGKYTARVPLGENKASVQPIAAPPGRLPPMYANYTGSVDVKSGSNKLDIDLKATGAPVRPRR